MLIGNASYKLRFRFLIEMLIIASVFGSFLLFHGSASAAEEITGTCGNSLRWALSNLGVLTITGSGTMDNYTSTSTPPWEAQKGSITKIIIENGVTSIGDYAFDNCKYVKEIEFPDGLISIGNYSFHICSSITSINLPDSVTSIGSYGFGECGGITTIHFSRSLKTIEQYAFETCSSLQEIRFSDGLLTIGRCAFSYCKKLNTIEIPGSVEIISEWAFSNSAATNVILHEGITTIGNHAFYLTDLTSIQLPSSLLSISYSAFGFCEKISNVTYLGTQEQANGISLGTDNVYLSSATWHFVNLPLESNSVIALPSTLRVIGSEAFSDISATIIVVPMSVQIIESQAFSRCPNLSMIVFEGSPNYIAPDIFGSKETVIISVVSGSSAEQWANDQGLLFMYH